MATTVLTPLKTYDKLRSEVAQTLLQGQKKIEALKVEVYWNTGNLLSQYLKNNPDANAIEVSARLSQDLDVERSLFYRVLQFAENFPKVATWRLSWSHYRELLAVPDVTKRTLLAREALQRNWPVRRLTREILKRRGTKTPGAARRESPGIDSGPLLEPKIGRLGIRKTKFLELVDGQKTLVVDLGFDNYKELPPSSGLVGKDLVAWDEAKKAWAKAGTEEDLYVYDGKVERVVDGDTLLVHVDLGFDITRRQYLRLRGLNAPEIAQAEGRKARDFLLKIFGKNPDCLFKSRFTDKYDRYLSDVWADDLYLNQELLDRRLAEKV